MIADRQPPRRRRTAQVPLMPMRSGVTRRELLVLAAAGLVVGCAPARTSATRAPTESPTPALLAPAARIGLANAPHMTALGTLSVSDGRLRGVAWSPDGSLIAAGGQSNVHVWSTQSGREVAAWRGHTNQIYGVSWSAANSLVASASDDGTVRLWHPADGSVARVLGRPPNDPISLAWSPDGTKLAAGDYAGQVRVWDIHTGRTVATWTGPRITSARSAVFGVAWSPDGQRVLSTRYDGFVLAWEAGTGRALATLPVASQPNAVAWSPDGRRFTSSHDDGTVRLWDGASYRFLAAFAAHDTDGWAFPMAWSPDGAVLAVARQTGLVQWYDVASGRELAALTGHLAGVWALAWAPDDLRVATASDDGTVRLWGIH